MIAAIVWALWQLSFGCDGTRAAGINLDPVPIEARLLRLLDERHDVTLLLRTRRIVPATNTSRIAFCYPQA